VNRKILAYLRDLDRGDGSHETVLCVANLSRFAQPVVLDLAAPTAPSRRDAGLCAIPYHHRSPYVLTLAPYSFLWLELQPRCKTGVIRMTAHPACTHPNHLKQCGPADTGHLETVERLQPA